MYNKSVMFKKIILTFALFFIFSPPTFATESAQFTSDITINQDSSLTIKETIIYTTDEPHHGIYRYLPKTPDEIPHLVKITDPDGKPYPYTTKIENGNLVIRIGDPNSTFTGQKTYQLTYTYQYPLKKVDNHYELYWDITGEGWKFPLKHVQATIHSPTKIIQIACYSGEYGSNDKLCQTHLIDDFTLNLTYPKDISWNQNLTLALKIDPNGIKGPGLIWKLKRHLLPYLFFILPTLILGLIWFKIGRDDLPQGKGKRRLFQKFPIPITAYEPPKELTPAQAGLLLDNKLDNRDLVAEIIDLARKKYLKLEKIETKKLLGKKIDYQFTQLKEADKNLPLYQRTLHQDIFKSGTSVKLSQLKGKFYKTLAKVRKQLYTSLKPFYHHSPKSGLFLIAFISTSFIQFIYLIFVLANNSITFNIYLFILTLVCLFLNFAFAKHLYSFTSKGFQHHLYLKGFYQNLKRGAWRDKIKEKHLFLEEVIPFAVAFGTVKQLAKAMKDLDLQPPEYLDSVLVGTSLNNLAHDLDQFATMTADNISYNPNSSSSSGSGFSGGFSGGGGGGGGGGSW